MNINMKALGKSVGVVAVTWGALYGLIAGLTAYPSVGFPLFITVAAGLCVFLNYNIFNKPGAVDEFLKAERQATIDAIRDSIYLQENGPTGRKPKAKAKVAVGNSGIVASTQAKPKAKRKSTKKGVK